MTVAERLKSGQKNVKQVFLMTERNEVIAERNFMELNWNNSMNERMRDLAMQSIRLFNIPLSQL
jgi:hypothetical protein